MRSALLSALTLACGVTITTPALCETPELAVLPLRSHTLDESTTAVLNGLLVAAADERSSMKGVMFEL